MPNDRGAEPVALDTVDEVIEMLYQARRKLNRVGLYDAASSVAEVMAELEEVSRECV